MRILKHFLQETAYLSFPSMILWLLFLVCPFCYWIIQTL